MSEEKSNDPSAPTEHADDAKSPGDELREGLLHLFSAARKMAKTAEPHLTRSLDDAERVINKLGRGGEAVATEVGREVAGLAGRVAERIRTLANRAEGNVPDERTPPEHASPSETKHDDETKR